MRLILPYLILCLTCAGCRTGAEGRPLLPLLARDGRAVAVACFGTPQALSREDQADSIALAGAQAHDKTEPGAVLPGASAEERVIDLDTALRLASEGNPRIALADEVVRANEADLAWARSLLFPTLNTGLAVSAHRGTLLAGTGFLREVNRESLYVGAGADTRGAGTVSIPGVQVVSHLGDAVFAPRLASQRVDSSRHDAVATSNVILLEVARAYLGLAGAEARLLALKQSEAELAELAKLTAAFAAKGIAQESDTLRTQAELDLLRGQMHRAEEEIVAQAAELARLLSLDTSVRLRPAPGPPPLVQLVDEATELETLVDLALAHRPEVVARNIDVGFFETRLRQEKLRPLVPTVAVGFSVGEFGGGSDLAGYRFGQFNRRADLDVVAVWSLQNFGAGNVSSQQRVRVELGAAESQRMHVIDQVRREVAEAVARVRASRQQMEIARRRVLAGQQAYREELLRTKDRLGRLIETLASYNVLLQARQELVQSMVAFSQAQFELRFAVGAAPMLASRATPPSRQ